MQGKFTQCFHNIYILSVKYEIKYGNFHMWFQISSQEVLDLGACGFMDLRVGVLKAVSISAESS